LSINGFFRLMLNPLVWQEASANSYATDGALTTGGDPGTLDGFSEERVNSIIQRLRAGSDRFQPVRRVQIPKKNGKKRPLGMSSGDDKLVQEVVRMILERIDEPGFENSSHGFRPGRSPHTARQQIADQWCAIKWLVDRDSRDDFNPIPHDLLMSLLTKKIEDKRLLHLIQAMLEAGD
jgi:retron-type reverse transcriptase